MEPVDNPQQVMATNKKAMMKESVQQPLGQTKANMPRVRDFLKRNTMLARNRCFGQPGYPQLKIVIGNTSSDMDSCVGSLALAWYFTLRSGNKIVYLPIMNCNKSEFKFKQEITMHLIDDCKIPLEDLYFMDEFRKHYSTDLIDETILFDHN